LQKEVITQQVPGIMGRESGTTGQVFGMLTQKSRLRMKESTIDIRDTEASRWHVGQNVTHAKFGTGVIVNCEGGGADARVQVKFNHAGTKWLSLEYAKLAST
jgi:ATP-dependent DNA helicase UvrD/PcrA